MCNHEHKNYQIPTVLNTQPREMTVSWTCINCGAKGQEKKLV